MFFLVNDNIDPMKPGAVDLFKSADVLKDYIEPWFSDEPHIVMDSKGRCYKITSDESNQKTLIHDIETEVEFDLFKEMLLRAFGDSQEKIFVETMKSFDDCEIFEDKYLS